MLNEAFHSLRHVAARGSTNMHKTQEMMAALRELGLDDDVTLE